MEVCVTSWHDLAASTFWWLTTGPWRRLNETERREAWEICEDRYQTRSTILTSQLPVSRWHEQIVDPTIADRILDRLVHNAHKAHRIEMRGESMRKKRNPPTDESKLWSLAYDLGSFWRRLGLPKGIENWSLTSLQHRLVKTGERLVKHARYYWLLLAEGHLNRRRFGAMLGPIALLPMPNG
jgi:hypothetical protein